MISDAGLLAAVAALLDGLQFTSDMPRERKWRTTEQLANELGLCDKRAFDRLDRVLRDHEQQALGRIEKGRPHQSLIRRAKYPDRTTAFPLWGSVRHHGPRRDEMGGAERFDGPEEIPPNLRLPENAPHIFLSHTRHDASLALQLSEALAPLGVGAWRFESHIDQREDIAHCVRKAITESAAVVGLVTRYSIASLWVLTELHTCMTLGRAAALVVNTKDAELMELLASATFHDPDRDYDLSVEVDDQIVERLKDDYGTKENVSRTNRYTEQVHHFFATLPKYLGTVAAGQTTRVWRPALAFPSAPTVWSAAGPIALGPIEDLVARLAR